MYLIKELDIPNNQIIIETPMQEEITLNMTCVLYHFPTQYDSLKGNESLKILRFLSCNIDEEKGGLKFNGGHYGITTLEADDQVKAYLVRVFDVKLI